MAHTTTTFPGGLRLRHLLLPLLCAFGYPVVAQTASWQAAMLVEGTQVAATATDASGNLYIVGSFTGTVALGTSRLTSAGGTDVYVAKWSPTTNSYSWAYRAGNEGQDVATTIAVHGSNVYIGGNFRSSAISFGSSVLTNTSSSQGGPYQDMFVAKLTDAGTSARFEWAQQAWGRYDESCTKLLVRDNQVYVVASMVGTPPPSGPGAPGCNSCPNEVRINNSVFNTLGPKADGILTKLVDAGSSASFAWATQISGGSDDTIGDIALAGSAIYVVGTSDREVFLNDWTQGVYILNLTHSNNKGYVLKLMEANNTVSKVWVQPIASSLATTVAAVAVVGTDIYVTGGFSGTMSLGAETMVSAGQKDVFAVKLTDAGSTAAVAWATSAGGSGDDTGSLVAASGQHVYLAGSFSNTATFGGNTLQSVGPDDAYIAKLTDSGSATAFGWAQQIGGTGHATIGQLYVTNSKVYLSGSVTLPATFGNIVLQNSTNSGWPGFSAVLTDPVLTSVASAKHLPLSLYPNPAHTSVQVPLATAATSLTLIDALGRTVRTAAGSALSVQGLIPGLYVLHATTPGQPLRTGHIVVE